MTPSLSPRKLGFLSMTSKRPEIQAFARDGLRLGVLVEGWAWAYI